MVKVLRTQLSRRGVRLDVLPVWRFATQLPVQLTMARRAASLRSATVVVWFSLTRSVPLFVYIVDGQGGRLSRQVGRSTGATIFSTSRR